MATKTMTKEPWEMADEAAKRIEQVIRNIERRKYSRIVQADYANTGVDLFNEHQMSMDLGIHTEDLEDVIPMKRMAADPGTIGLAIAPSPATLRAAIPKLSRYLRKQKVGFLLRRGKPVPAEVLKDYPELQSPPKMQVGQQAGSLGVPQKVHTQKSTGKAVTASMESFAKLQRARAEAAPEKEVAKEIFGTLSHEDASELLAGLDLRIDALEGRVDEGRATLESIKESVNPKVAKLTELIPTTKEGKGEITHITKGQYRKVWGREPKANILTKDGKRVRWEYALDEIAQELHLEPIAQAQGKAPDEYLKGLIEEAKDTKELIRATESEVRSDESTLKALEKLKGTIKARTGKVTDGKLLQKLAKAPTVKPLTKPKPATKAKAIMAGVAQELIAKTQAKRSPRAIMIDNALLAKQVVPVSKVETWAKHPNRLDIRGVDTPGSGRIRAGVAYSDKGKQRLSRRHHRGWKKVKLA